MSEGGLGYATVADAEEVVDVAIVGGGLAGIAAALRLAESGLSVHLIEAKSRDTIALVSTSKSPPRLGELSSDKSDNPAPEAAVADINDKLPEPSVASS